MTHIILYLLLLSIQLFSAAFNSTDSIINVPIAKQFRVNEIQFGLSTAYNGSTSLQDTDQRYEVDFKGAYTFTEKFQFALNLVNDSTFVGHYHYTLTDRFSTYQTGVGLRNISASNYSTWGDGEYVEAINMSPYVVNTFYTPNSLFSIGYGLRAFQNQNTSLEGIGSFLQSLNGVFFGFSYTKQMLTFLAEYDGRDVNFGVMVKPKPYYEIHIGLTEQFIDGDYNPQHENAPKRHITFGFTYRDLFSPSKHYNKTIHDLNKIINDYETRELERIEEKSEKVDVALVTETEKLQSKVIDLYSQSLSYYNQRDYEKSLKLLHTALNIDPTNYLILARLGSVYYAYGFMDKATFYWRRAIEINPNAKELDDVKQFLNQ